MNAPSHIPRFEGAQLVLGGPLDTSETYDARYLISMLLVHTAKSDGAISEAESALMIELLSTQLKISTPEALRRLTSAINALSNDTDIVARLRTIGRGMSQDEKCEVLKMMIQVMTVDDHLARGEVDAIMHAGQIIGLSLDTIHSELRSITVAK